MTIIEAKIGQNGRNSKGATFLKVFALSGLKSNDDLYRLESY